MQTTTVAIDCDRCSDGRIVAVRGERLHHLRTRAAADGWWLGRSGPDARAECPPCATPPPDAYHRHVVLVES